MDAWPRVGQAFVTVLAAGLAATAVVVVIRLTTVLVQEEPEVADHAWPMAVVAIAFVSVGTLLALEPGQRLNGTLLVAFGALFYPIWADNVLSPTMMGTIAAITEVPWLCLGWMLLRYPEHRLSHWFERAYLILAAIWLTSWGILEAITWRPAEATDEQVLGLPSWLPNHDLNQIAELAFWFGSVVLYAGFVVLMLLRARRARGLDRATYRPTYIAAGAMAIASMAAGLSGVRAWYPLQVVQWLALLMIAVVLLNSVGRRRMARSRIADLVMQVSNATSPAAVEVALRRTMAEPDLTVQFWSPDHHGYVDVRGQPANDAPSDARLALPVNNRDGEPLAVVHADASVQHHRDLLDAALAASSLALENAALHASLLARLAEVQESRTRLAETAIAERRRIERDLHDGAQQALLALGMTLGRAQAAADRTTAANLLTKARGELTAALEELRHLARGLYPAMLTQLGLGPAMQVIAERLPVDVALEVPKRRWPEAAETTAYFIACEALANAVKHADATHVRVHVTDRPDRLVLQVIDDGKGGACATDGHGLLNMHDRAAALGGSLSICSATGLGTVIAAELPCG